MSVLCMSGHGPMPSGMAPMYALIGLFRLPAWLRLVSGYRQMGSSVAGRSNVPYTKRETTVGYFGIEVDDALAISEQVRLCGGLPLLD